MNDAILVHFHMLGLEKRLLQCQVDCRKMSGERHCIDTSDFLLKHPPME